MIKLNRIGNKLGLAGLVGLLLSGGMVVNQMVSESAINLANQRADTQQAVAVHALEGNVGLRRMQIAAKEIRLARDPSGVEKGVTGLGEAYAVATKELDVALGKAVRPENKERLQKIMLLAGEYEKGVSVIAKTRLTIFEVLGKRNDLVTEWNKAFKELLGSPELTAAANRIDIEKFLHETDSKFNAVRAASWRFVATGDDNQNQVINSGSAELNDALSRARNLASARGVLGSIDALASIAKGFSSATGEATKAEMVEKEITDRTLAFADQAVKLMRTAVDAAERLTEDAKTQAMNDLSQANRVSFIMAIVVMAGPHLVVRDRC